MHLESQAKLLRVLQDGVVERVGSSKTRQVDVRVIAATNRDLRERVERGEFREDSYFRLEVLPVYLPPLRERIEDLPLLIKHFREKLGVKIGLDAAARLAPRSWTPSGATAGPGNVRELEHTLEQLFILANDDVLTARDLPEKFNQTVVPVGDVGLPPGGLSLEELEEPSSARRWSGAAAGLRRLRNCWG